MSLVGEFLQTCQIKKATNTHSMLNPDRIGLEPVPQGPTAQAQAEFRARHHPSGLWMDGKAEHTAQVQAVPEKKQYDIPDAYFRNDRLGGTRAPPKVTPSHKAQLKAVMADDAIQVADKRPGYRNRYGGAVLYHQGKPIHSVAKLLPCTRPECDQVEKSLKHKFKQCTMCLTVYCSPACQKLDWPAHKAGCKANAYYEQRSKWENDTPGIPNTLFGYSEEYMALWDQWIATKPMQAVLKHCGLDAAKLREALEPSKDPAPSKNAPRLDPESAMRLRDLKAAAEVLQKATDPKRSENLTYGDLKSMFTPLVCSMFDNHPELLNFDTRKIQHHIDKVCLVKFKEVHKPFVVDDAMADVLICALIGMEISRRKATQEEKKDPTQSMMDGLLGLVRMMFKDHPELLEEGSVDKCMAKFFELHGKFKNDQQIHILVVAIVQHEISFHKVISLMDDE